MSHSCWWKKEGLWRSLEGGQRESCHIVQWDERLKQLVLHSAGWNSFCVLGGLLALLLGIETFSSLVEDRTTKYLQEWSQDGLGMVARPVPMRLVGRNTRHQELCVVWGRTCDGDVQSP